MGKYKNKFLIFLFILSVFTNAVLILKFVTPKAILLIENKTLQEDSNLADSKINAFDAETRFINGLELSVYGKYHNEQNFNRLPTKYADIVRPIVWELSKNSSGISISFLTNSPYIKARWSLMNNTYLSNMTAIAASGLDLYVRNNNSFQYVSSGIPIALNNECTLISNMDSTLKEFRLYLPLFNGIDAIEIGIADNATITTPTQVAGKINPIVFYGTSITQGGSASRPGMAYPSIISRSLNIEIINFGFSGNGRFEQSVGQALNEIEASIYVIDCTPNSHPDTIAQNALKLISQLTNKQTNKQTTPILLIESIYRTPAYLKHEPDSVFGTFSFITKQNQELLMAYEQALEQGFTNIHYLDNHSLIGSDKEGTVDGTHFTDLGHFRMATVVQRKLENILSESLK
jgi:hypothetical protein